MIKAKKRFLRSKPFYAGGFQFFFGELFQSRLFFSHFCLGMFPFGEGDPAPNKMTCCLFLDPSADKTPPNTTITLDFSISVVNWLFEPMTVSHFHSNVQFPLSTENAGWGPEAGCKEKNCLETSN